MDTDVSKYVQMKEHGATPEDVVLQAKNDGLGSVSRIELAKSLFRLSVSEAKELVVQSDGNASLDEYQSKIADIVEDGRDDDD